MNTSRRRLLASRANGALSNGPKTPEGKARASANAIRHGLLARQIVLDNESRETFENLLDQYTGRFQPADAVEFDMIEEMAASYWRLRRSWAIETELFNNGLRQQPPGEEIARLASAFSELAVSPQLALLHRYESRLHRMFQVALSNLVLLREVDLPKEPSPITGHLELPSGPIVLDPAA